MNDEEHEQKLIRLWKLLKPDQKLKELKTDQWQEIGFQVIFYYSIKHLRFKKLKKIIFQIFARMEK